MQDGNDAFCTAQEKPKMIAFTFDDGPNTVITPKVLELFDRYGGKATFFLIGQNISEESAHVAKLAFDKGHEIENHSLSHRAFTELSREEMCEETKKTDDLIEKITGRVPEFFRPPYIAYDDATFDAVDKTFICGLGCDDWDEKVPVEKRVKDILSFADDGVIVLLHDSDYNQATVDALEEVLPKLKEEGYEFVTLRQLFEAKDEPYGYSNGRIYSKL